MSATSSGISAHREEVAAHGGDHRRQSAPRRRRQRGHVTRPRRLVEPVPREELLHLVDHDQEPRLQGAIRRATLPLRVGDRTQRGPEDQVHVVRVVAQRPRQPRRVDAAGAELGQGRVAEKRLGQSVERVAGRVAGTDHAPAPDIDPLHPARRRHQGVHQTGADERRLARPAHPEDQQERAVSFGLLLEGLLDRRQRPCAAVKHRRVLQAKRLQARIGNAVTDDFAFPGLARLLGFLADQLAQVRFELLLELVRRLERVKRRLERAVFVKEPTPDERLERRELLQSPLPLGLVVERKWGVAHPAVNDKVGSPAPSIRLGRRLQLINRP